MSTAVIFSVLKPSMAKDGAECASGARQIPQRWLAIEDEFSSPGLSSWPRGRRLDYRAIFATGVTAMVRLPGRLKLRAVGEMTPTPGREADPTGPRR